MSAVVAVTSYLIPIVKSVWSVSRLYLFWISVHYSSSNLYTHLCTPNSIWGFIQSPFMVISPQCYTIDWVRQKSRDIILNMWSIIGMWGASQLMTKLDPRHSSN